MQKFVVIRLRHMLSANDKVAEARTGRDIDFQIALGALGALTEELFQRELEPLTRRCRQTIR